MRSKKEIKEAVYQGAKLLRQHDPRWFLKVVNPKIVRPNKEEYGILHQVFDTTDIEGGRKLFSDEYFFAHPSVFYHHGFEADSDEEYDLLDAEWERLVNKFKSEYNG